MKKFKVGQRVKDKMDNAKGTVIGCPEKFDGVFVKYDDFKIPMYIHNVNLIKLKPKQKKLPTRIELHTWLGDNFSGDSKIFYNDFHKLCNYLGIK